MATPTRDRENILKAVQEWSPDEQIALVRDILEHLSGPFIEEPTAPPDSRGLAGLLANGRIPPTDEEVAQWLDERRVEKYGH
ncbi:MAG: hypothetical protein ACRDHP_16400 [Ktedonobacterales bacterium]